MIYRLVALLLLTATTAFATGSVDVMDPITKLGKKIKGGNGIDITAGVITNSASRVPITSSTGVILFSSTGCAAGWQTTMATEIAQYAAVGIQADHIVCYPYTPPAGGASFTFPSVAATGAAGSMTIAYTSDAAFSFPAVSGTGAVGTFTAAAGAAGDAMFTFPSVSGDGAAGVMTAEYTSDGSFTFPAVTGTGAVGTLTVDAVGTSLTVPNPSFESSLAANEGAAGYTNWWAVADGTGGVAFAERLASAEMTGSYVLRLKAVGSGDPDYTASAAYGVFKATKDTIDAGSVMTMDLRTKTVSPATDGYGLLYVLAYDSGDALIIDSPSTGKHELKLFGADANFLENVDKTTLAFVPTVNGDFTKSFNVKTWITSRLASGKTWADVSYVKFQFYVLDASGDSMELYLDNFR